MSIERCDLHDRNWDSDFHDECPSCRVFQCAPAHPTGQGAKRTLPETGSSGMPSNIIFPKDQEIDHG